MSKFKMEGFPNHHTGMQPKKIGNPIKYDPMNPFAGEEFAVLFAPTKAGNPFKGGKGKAPKKNPEYKMDSKQMDTNITSGSSSRATPTANNQTGAAVDIGTSSSSSSYSWP